MYIFKLKLSEKERGYCMYVFLVTLIISAQKKNFLKTGPSLER